VGYSYLPVDGSGANGAPAIEVDAHGENMQIYGYVVDHET
jgi:hypothetical protein